MKTILQVIKALLIVVIAFTLLFPHMDNSIAVVKRINTFGLFNLFLLLVIPLLVSYLALLYFNDKESFKRKYPKENLLIHLGTIVVIALMIYKLM
ncbi:hypothetical protein [Flavobacterium suaedae]|nr:hypothetical protein [Flavobacterium suaedae]